MDVEKSINYIFNYIKYVFFNVEEFKDDKSVLDLSKKIRNNMPKSDFTSGNLDFYIADFVLQQLKLRYNSSYLKYSDIKNHIYLIMNYYKIYHNINIENYNEVICEVMRKICAQYSYSDIIDGKCDDRIEELISSDLVYGFDPYKETPKLPINIMYFSYDGNNLVNDKDYMYEYIFRILNSNSNTFVFEGDLKVLAELICDDMCRVGIMCEDVLAHEYDDYIVSYIRKNKFGVTFVDEYKNIYTEVSKFVMNNNSYMEIANYAENEGEETYNLAKYLFEAGYTSVDVINGKCNDIMERHLRLDCIKANSKICRVKEKGKQNPNKFPLSLNKVMYPTKSKALVLALIVSLGFGIFSPIEKEEEIKYEYIDTYEYPDIPYALSNEFVESLSHVMTQYIENASISPEYGQICMYKAFKSIDGEPYSVMDSFMELIKDRARYNEDVKILYEDVKDCESYIDFMYKNLGEDKDENMKSAVITYNSQVANYKELNPYSLLTRDEKSEIKKLENMYGRHINKLEKELEQSYGKER